MLLRTVQVTGLISAVGTLVLYVVFVWFNPYTPNEMTLPVAARMAVGGLGVFAAYKTRPYLMLLVFAMSFIPLGLYLLGAPGIFRLIGLLDIAYLVAGVLAWVVAMRAKTTARKQPLSAEG